MISLRNSVRVVLLLAVVEKVYLYAPKMNNQPLYVTPYIESGKIEEGQQAALVQNLNNENLVSYTGFITINKEYNSNMFFWFYPAEKDSENAPLVLWLHGGPGGSSVYGLFELGPYYIDKNNHVQKRKNYLSQTYNMLYIDNPIGTGFSYTENDKGYSRDETDIGENLHEALNQFFKLFPKYQKNNFYLSGSSYAGKFCTALAYTIDKNQNQNPKINLKGMIIGNGFFDPAITIQRSGMFYENGLIDLKYKLELEAELDAIIKLINEGKFKEALDLNTMMRKTLAEKTGYSSLSNLLYNTEQYPYNTLDEYLNRTDTRRKIHIGNRPFTNSDKLIPSLENELMQTVKPWFEIIVNKYKVLLYNGGLDLECSYVSTEKFIDALNWNGAQEYKNAKRNLWYFNNELAGYNKTAGKLTEVMVRNAGHNAHIDKPLEVYELFKQLIYNLA